MKEEKETKLICMSEPNKIWDTKVLYTIYNKVSKYAIEHNIKKFNLISIEDNTWSDKRNKRYDIEIQYINDENCLIQQKLLYLKGEILDGMEFHIRFKEFYDNDLKENMENDIEKDDELELD